jgi:hypothetical protein
MPVSKFYNPLSKPKGEVSVPGPNDPVQLSRQGNTTMMDFGGAEPARVGGGDLMQGLRDLFMGKEDLPEAPESADAAMGYEPLEMAYGQDYQIPSFEPAKAKPTETYGTNRGGTGSAGRKSSTPQLGASQFDVGPQFMETEDEMSIADLRKLDDKPWELDQNTAVDVAPGTSLTPQTESEASEKLDLDTPQGIYKALSQRYPDILTRNLDELEGARVTAADTDALRERGNLGSLFIAASKAASGAGSVRGKTAESIAEKIVSREDTLARQQLKDRLDVARENMALNAKAVDLAMKQIDFADEREQYDPNSDVSQFARDFMQQEFGVKVPSNVPAYQLRQFLPAIVQKYQAQERAKYQGALLEQRGTEAKLDEAYRQLKLAQDANDREAERKLKEEIARLNREAKKSQKAEKPIKMLGGVSADVAKVEMDLAKQFRSDKTVQSYDLISNAYQQLKSLSEQGTSSADQGLIMKFNKVLDEGSVVRETEFAITEEGGGLINKFRNMASKVASGQRLQPQQRKELVQTAGAILEGIKRNYQVKRKQFIQQGNLYGARPEAVVGIEQPAPQTAPSGTRSVQEIDAEIEAVKEQIRRRGGK